ncbi:DegV domain-containing protein [Virgisporangium aliadipatigenens]|uniref:DegV domain-containing protein n=1 Tax=Virgisporangium aliadipatigenens TaxID=741659 RepID=A0A8J4DTF3_9ACTN|nr:DegV family protein [Virgisporangium aliadipatigenens]GIJ49719.1 DegV domain-containing protein [Virgisporangium aliadipatigenens]
MAGSTPRIAVVTDSTAALPADVAHELTVVPVTVAIDGRSGLEGDNTPADVAEALAARRPVTTSRPTPTAFAETYDKLFAAGAERILSVHISGALSGTAGSASVAAAEYEGRVEVLDTRSAGMGVGFPALAAVEAARAGAELAAVRAAAEDAMRRTTPFIYVDTLEFLRRGGRIGAPQALLGTALAVKPILGVRDGVVVPLDKVRTAARALSRLVERAEEAAGGARVDVAVQHVAAPERMDAVLSALVARLDVRHRYTGEVSAVLAAHAGPGLVCAVISVLERP